MTPPHPRTPAAAATPGPRTAAARQFYIEQNWLYDPGYLMPILLAIEAEAAAAPGLRAALDVALAEFDNIRWDDIWSRVDASGDDELARMSRKYSLYVRDAIVEARAALAAEEER